jgi:FAD/FMN-containing dehydrogenase
MGGLRVTTTTGAERLLEAAVVKAFGTSLRGSLFCPGDAEYEEARRVWNGSIDRRPALIVRCAGTPDVVSCVDFARTNSLPISVRGGGHNVAGNAVCTGGLTIDLSLMKSIHVDSASRKARAEAGLTWGEFDRSTQEFGLATTGGICSEAGIAGVTLGGGFGWLMRKHGLALDNLETLEIVTADGQLRRASSAENADLFFAVRGTHSNFGVVTSLEYRLHPVGPTVLAGMVLHPLENAREVLKFYREYTGTAPEEIGAWAALLTAPNGHRMVAILACYVGSSEDGKRVLRPLKEFGSPVMDMIQPMPYVKAQSLIDESFPKGRCNYWKSSLLRRLSDGAIETFVEGFRKVASPYSSVLIEQLGGAVARIREDETAFSHRDSPYDCVIMPMWSDPRESEKHIRWADDLWLGIQPFSSGGVYVNYLGNEGEERVKTAYGVNYQRLAALKSKYDASNLFRFNQNIKPAV